MSRSNSICRARPLLGTLVEIWVEEPSATSESAIGAAFAAVARVHELMSVHAPDSDLSRLNREGHRRPVQVDPWTYSVLAAAKRIGAASHGVFDCGVAPVMVRYGWLPRRARRSGGFGGSQRHVRLLDGCRVRFRQPLALDLGGIAKGFAVDRAVDALKANGVAAGAVNAGGDLCVFGPVPQLIHLRHPSEPRWLVPAGYLAEGAIATSAHYYARRRRGGRWISPIIHPKRGTPVAADRSSVSVIAQDALTADALTKPVMLLGEAAAGLLARFGARAVILRPGCAPIELGHAA